MEFNQLYFTLFQLQKKTIECRHKSDSDFKKRFTSNVAITFYTNKREQFQATTVDKQRQWQQHQRQKATSILSSDKRQVSLQQPFFKLRFQATENVIKTMENRRSSVCSSVMSGSTDVSNYNNNNNKKHNCDDVMKVGRSSSTPETPIRDSNGSKNYFLRWKGFEGNLIR